MKNTVIASFALSFLLTQAQSVIAMEPLQIKISKEESTGWFLTPKQYTNANGLVNRMSALLGQINRNFRYPTPHELDQVRGRYEELMDILEQYDRNGNIVPIPQEWRQMVGIIEKYFDHWAQLKNEPYLHEPREERKMLQQRATLARPVAFQAPTHVPVAPIIQGGILRPKNVAVTQASQVHQQQKQEGAAQIERAVLLQWPEKPSLPKQEQAPKRQWKFSNQSEKMATIFTLVSSDCYQQKMVYPGDDYGPVTISQRPYMFLYTAAGTHVVSVDSKNNLLLEKEAPLGEGTYDFEIIKTMPFDEAKDTLFIINSMGEVDFIKRNL